MQHLNFVPMGFETHKWINRRNDKSYLNFVPMGFETHIISYLFISKIIWTLSLWDLKQQYYIQEEIENGDLNFVPMGFETQQG